MGGGGTLSSAWGPTSGVSGLGALSLSNRSRSDTDTAEGVRPVCGWQETLGSTGTGACSIELTGPLAGVSTLTGDSAGGCFCSPTCSDVSGFFFFGALRLGLASMSRATSGDAPGSAARDRVCRGW